MKDDQPANGRRGTHFTATGFLVRGSTVLLVHHRKLDMWLPFGGHVEPDEDPAQALLREAREETGFNVEIIAEARDYGAAGVRTLPRPETILLEEIGPDHFHIDLIYFVRPLDGEARLATAEHHAMRWFNHDELDDPRLTADVRALGRRALEQLGTGA